LDCKGATETSEVQSVDDMTAMDASQRYTFYRRKHRPGVPKKLQSDLAERSRRSVPKIQSTSHAITVTDIGQKDENKPDDLKN
jgi:hypothetical protein